MEGDEAVEGLLAVHVGGNVGVLTSVLAFGDLAVEAHLLGNDLQINMLRLYRVTISLYRLTHPNSKDLLLTWIWGVPAAGGPLLKLPTAQAAWRNIPNLSQQEVFTV